MSALLPENVDAVLPLSPAQSGILFHCIGANAAQGSYVGVVSADLEGPLDDALFQGAFADTVMATDALRACFVWEGVKRPLQVVRKRVELSWDVVDWTGLGAEAMEQAAAGVVDRYRRTGFDLSQAPLMHITLARIGPDRTCLIWAVHHIISDGWSTRCLLDNILARYNGQKPAGAQTQFRDYLGWLKARDAARDQAYWSEALAGLTAPTRIETVVDAATDQAPMHMHVHRTLPAELLTRIEARARSSRVTQSTLMSTVWALVLRRYARSDDIVFGSTTAGRPAELPGADKAAGAFLNTVPIRLQLDPSSTVEATLQAAEAGARRRRAHEAAALSDIQSWSPMPPGTAIFDYVFAFERLPEVAQDTGPLRLGHLETVQSSNYPLTFLVTPGEGLKIEVYFDPARFTPALIDDLLDDFERLLRAVLRRDRLTVADLSNALPVIPAPAPLERPPVSVLEAISAAAEQAPDATALSDSAKSLSYAELSGQIEGAAQRLVAAGAAPGDVIPVAMPRGVDAVVAMLAVMRAGAAYVPLDITYPRARIEQVLAEVAPKFVVAAEVTPAFSDIPALLIDHADAPSVDLPDLPGGADTAYVIFTSGSQGRPKGVQITHANLAHSNAVRADVYGQPPETFLLLSSLAFDSSVAGLYWTLTTGGHLVIADSGIEQDAGALAAVIARHKVRTTLCLPRLFEALVNAGQVTALASLKTVIVAGEAVTAASLAARDALGGGARLFNEYGPTEATVWCTAADLTDQRAGQAVPIGRPIPGVAVCICDRDGRPLPDGVLGEIVVTGPTVSPGYLHGGAGGPFRGAGTSRSYATGDLGVRRADGQILFFGREDQQVKIRGVRVDLSEVEACAHAVAHGIELCAVIAQSAVTPTLVLCLAHGEDPDLAACLSAAFQAQLPAHSRPARLQWMPAFPRLPNGKVDVAELAVRTSTKPERQQPEDPPRGDTEQRLAEIWCDVLGREAVARNADFFELGGDSLLSIGLFARAEQEGLPIRPTDIFDHPTLAGLAQALVRRSAEDDAEGPAESPLKLANTGGARPPVFLLHCNMWIYRQLTHGLGSDWPVGLQFSHHFHGARVALGGTIEDFATEALGALTSLRDTGPYILCGYSAGAMITLDLARRLHAQGHEVPLVCLIDPPYDGRSSGGPALPDLAMQGMTLARGLAERALERVARDGEAHRRNVVSQAYALAMRRYRLQPYNGPVHVLQTDGNPAMAAGGTLRSALHDVEVETLPFGHQALLTDSEARLSLTSRMVRRIRRV